MTNVLNTSSKLPKINIVAEIGHARFQLESLEQAEALMSIISKAKTVKTHFRPKSLDCENRQIVYRTGERVQLTIDLESNGIISKEELEVIIAADEAELAEQEDDNNVDVAA